MSGAGEVGGPSARRKKIRDDDAVGKDRGVGLRIWVCRRNAMSGVDESEAGKWDLMRHGPESQ